MKGMRRRRWTCLRSKQDRQSPILHKRMTGPYLNIVVVAVDGGRTAPPLDIMQGTKL